MVTVFQRPGFHRCLIAAGALVLCTLKADAQSPATADVEWSERDTRLANEYLALLVQQPDYGRVVDLLWDLYARNDATKLLLENIATQAKDSPHTSVRLVHAHLLRRSGDLPAAATLYEAVLKSEPQNRIAIRSLADVSLELKQPERAIKLLRQIAEALPDTDPSKPEAWIELGTVSLGAGQNAAAAAAWEKAASLRPTDAALVKRVSQLLLQGGFPDKAADHLAKLTQTTTGVARLDNLTELARVREHAGQFEPADKALRDALAMVDFRDGRYAEVFRRLVRLHERFGHLDPLREELLAAARKSPPQEKALSDMARFLDATVDVEERIQWLKELRKAFPQNEGYRWELVRALLDRSLPKEAAPLIDERLKGDGTDLLVIVLLRCEADILASQPQTATQRLAAVLDRHTNDLDIEKQILAFAQKQSLDTLIERILQARVQRAPDQADAVFALASFYRSHRDPAKAEQTLKSFTSSGLDQIQKLGSAVNFLASGNDTDAAINLARQAAASPKAGREEWLRLADLLNETSQTDEARDLLEKAWTASATDSEREDVDERLYALLIGSGQKKNSSPSTVSGTGADFKIPDAFSGANFASDDPAPNLEKGPPSIVIKQADQMAGVVTKAGLKATAAQRFRAAWWANRAERNQAVYDLLFPVIADPQGGASIEAQKLLLDVALRDQNALLATRLLTRLSAEDPDNRSRYALREGEILLEAERQRSSMFVSDGTAKTAPGAEAVAFFEKVLRQQPGNEALWSALAQCYVLQRRPDDAVKLWKQAITSSQGAAAVPLLERYAELLLKLNRMPEYVAANVQIMEHESDVNRRRDLFKRFMDRFLWSDTAGGEVAPDVLKERLKLVETELTDQVRRHPFDGFYQEALAQVYSRDGDSSKAYTAMKQAYYTAPDTPFSLDQLREAAVAAGDLPSAIYFQKQITASAPLAKMAEESRLLVDLMERGFQITEADEVRRRLEARFSQDVKALDELANYYADTSQDEAERRVLQQIVKVQPWDARSRLRLAMKHLRLADDADAQRELEAVLKGTSAPKIPRPLDRMALPLTDVRNADGPGSAADVADLLSMTDTLSRTDVERLNAFLHFPRPEFAELPDDPSLIRLRAIEELARLVQRGPLPERDVWIHRWSQPTEDSTERLWGLFYSKAYAPFREHLVATLSNSTSIDHFFSTVWLLLRAEGMADALAWRDAAGLSMDEKNRRQKIFLATLNATAQRETWSMPPAQWQILGNAHILRYPEVLELISRLQDQQRYPEALTIAISLQKDGTPLPADYSFIIARLAEAAERWDLARQNFENAVTSPLRGGSYNMLDSFLLSLSSLNRIAESPQERERVLRGAWRRLAEMPSSPLTGLRRAAVIGLSGANEAAGARLAKTITGDFVSSRFVEDTSGRLPSQGAMGRVDEPPQARSLWEETKEIQADLSRHGLASVIRQLDDSLDKRWGGLALSPRTGDEFTDWRLRSLIQRMRDASHDQRLQMLRAYLGPVDMRTESSVDVLSELGSRLESEGMTREAVFIYQMLPPRAPANADYAQWLLRACENSLDIEPGRAFSLQLILAEPPLKPPSIGDEGLRETHAKFMSRAFDIDALREFGFRETPSTVMFGRIPEEVPYLRELAFLMERLKRPEEALAAWQRLNRTLAALSERGLSLDPEASVHCAQALEQQGQTEAALKELREVSLEEPLQKVAQEALILRTQLAIKSNHEEEARDLMRIAVERQSPTAVLAIAKTLEKTKPTEALSLLIQASRTLKAAPDRFRLTAAHLRLLALQDPKWQPSQASALISAMLRTQMRDRSFMEEWLQWLKTEATTTRAPAWAKIFVAEMRSGPDRALAAMSACAFAKHLPPDAEKDLTSAWTTLTDDDRICVELGVAALLDADKADWAWAVCVTAAEAPSPRLSARKLPIMVRVAHARNDLPALADLFSEVIRTRANDGGRLVEWAAAFEKAGQIQQAREILSSTLDNQNSP
ncbi:MAG: tetratricopeptide repeat protein, partial [Verrucomicrobiales bacterium]|nr:tetratricopeptide repeat protein [Verrucomicrobiales bacterium]